MTSLRPNSTPVLRLLALLLTTACEGEKLIIDDSGQPAVESGDSVTAGDSTADTDTGGAEETGATTDTGGDTAMDSATDTSEVTDTAASATPASCQDILVAEAGAEDGEYTLYLGGDSARPWQAYCLNMDTEPAEYLVLAMTGTDYNFAQYTAGGASPGTSVRTSYTRLRLDPETLLVDISDQTFSTSTGTLDHGGGDVTSMPFGVAMSCDERPSGMALVDLSGTPFAVEEDAFVKDGFRPTGGATYDSTGQIVEIAGGGWCGWVMPAPSDPNPYNVAGDFQLPLHYLE